MQSFQSREQQRELWWPRVQWPQAMVAGSISAIGRLYTRSRREPAMPRFIALPVRQGDAFYLEREGFSMLIDGGANRSALPSIFRRSTDNEDSVDVIVCTHNDADHAKGILGFLESSLRCREVWLPGRWLSVLPDVLRPCHEVVEELVHDVEELGRSSCSRVCQSRTPPIEAYAERTLGPVTDAPTAEAQPIAGDERSETYRSMIEVRKILLDHVEPCRPDCEEWSRRLDPACYRLLCSAIDAADRIRAIAAKALCRGLTIRWFEHVTSSPSGGVPELRPLNAREVTGVAPRPGSFLDSAALTVVNKESLVFWSPPAECHPGVLFTADSDLAGVRLPRPLGGAIVTAPHHGSDDNAKAYGAVTVAAGNGAPSITWVRSDRKWGTRPGETYLRASCRFCTLCRLPEKNWTEKKAVRLDSHHGTWVPHPATRKCSCQPA